MSAFAAGRHTEDWQVWLGPRFDAASGLAGGRTTTALGYSVRKPGTRLRLSQSAISVGSKRMNLPTRKKGTRLSSTSLALSPIRWKTTCGCSCNWTALG